MDRWIARTEARYGQGFVLGLVWGSSLATIVAAIASGGS